VGHQQRRGDARSHKDRLSKTSDVHESSAKVVRRSMKRAHVTSSRGALAVAEINEILQTGAFEWNQITSNALARCFVTRK
jgi:hypothetical protein